MKKNTAKRALLMSTISLLLCVSMLVGTTFAWFTDSVASGNNVIAAGNLDIELEYYSHGTKTWNKVDAQTDKLFTAPDGETEILWEPGAVAYTNLKVSNVGTLALNYALSLNFSGENYIEETGNKLSQVLKVAFVKDGVTGSTREELLDQVSKADIVKVDTLKNMTYTVGHNNQEDLVGKKDDVVDSDVYGVVVWWEPSADDNNWNVNNGKKTSDGEQLHINLGVKLVATQKAKENDSFGPDYDYTSWTKVYDEAGLLGAIASGETNIALGGNITMNEKLVIPANVSAYAMRSAVTGITLNLGGYTLTVPSIINEGGLNLKNGIVKGDIDLTESTVIAMDSTIAVQNIIIDDIKDIPEFFINSIGATFQNIVIEVASAETPLPVTQDQIKTALEKTEASALVTTDESGKIVSITVVPGNNSEKVEDGEGMFVSGSTYYILNADGLKTFADSVNKYSNYEYPYKDETVVLMNDIDLGGMEWTPIGDYRFSANRFCGTFDGQGHTISNFKITKKTDKNDSNKSSYGFFGNVEGTVKNLIVANATVSSYAYTGALIGRLNSGLVENCHVVNCTVAPSYWQGGIMIGQVNGGSVKNCTVSNSSISGKSALGGMFGPTTAENGDLLFENCSVQDSVIAQAGSFGGNYDKYFGGMFGYIEAKGDKKATLNNCKVTNTTVKGEISSVLSGDNDGNVYIDGAKIVLTAAELTSALKAGGTVTLGKNITVEKDIAISNADFVLDGNGYTITGSSTYGLMDITGGKATVKNVTFDSVNGPIIRTVSGVKFNATNVSVQNCTSTQQQGLFRLLGESTIENCVFKNNTCNMAISLNYDTDDNVDPQVVNGCVFENNTCSVTAVLYYAHGTAFTANGNKFLNNTVNTTGNAATVYVGFMKNATITNNLFQGNDVTGTTKRVAGGLMIGYDAKISGNAFIDNTVTGSVEGLGNDVCASVYYTDIDLSGNYWGGSAPVADDDYYQEYTNHNVIINDYLTSNPF